MCAEVPMLTHDLAGAGARSASLRAVWRRLPRDARMSNPAAVPPSWRMRTSIRGDALSAFRDAFPGGSCNSRAPHGRYSPRTVCSTRS